MTVKKLSGLLLVVALIMTLLAPTALGVGAPLGIENNGLGGLYIDINSAPYTTFAQKDYGEYAYNRGGCAWFASSRVNEITGKGNVIWSGESWYNGRGAELGFSTGKTIKAKALACYSHHVSVIEAISGDRVLVSEGGYSDDESHGYCIIHWKTVDQIEVGETSSLGSFLGYVYLGVSGTVSESDSNDKITSIKFANDTMFMNVGSTITPSLTISPSSAASSTKITLSSSNPSVAAVSGSTITGVTSGYSIITATASGKTDQCIIYVKFNDVNNTSAYYFTPVYWAVGRGITSGAWTNAFAPSNECTRAQVLTFLWKTLSCPKATSQVNFTDVAQDSYYYDAVQWAYSQGITSGTSATTFSPNKACTRAEVVTFLWHALGSPGVETSTTFSDVSPTSYYAVPVAWASQSGITTGTSATTFSPKNICTRGQTMTFLYHIYG